MSDYDLWTAPMRQYELRARIEPHAREYVDSLDCESVVNVDSFMSRVDVDGFSPEDVDSALRSVLNGMCGEDGSLTATDFGYVKKSAGEIERIIGNLAVQYHEDNREWRLCCYLMVVFTGMWIFSHLWGADVGMRQLPMPLFGLPTTFYDFFYLDGVLLMLVGLMMRRLQA